jgi:DNA-binding transcriptional regulator YiaG
MLARFSRRPVAVRERLFQTAKASSDGLSVVWEDGSEIGLSWLQDLALAQMTNQEFRSALGKLGLTVEEGAAHLGVSKRSVAGYRRDREIPRSVALAVRFMLERRARVA